MTQTLDPLLTTVNKSQTPAKKAKWHLGKFYMYSLDWPSDHLSLAFSCCKRPQYDPPERFSMLIDLS